MAAINLSPQPIDKSNTFVGLNILKSVNVVVEFNVSYIL